MKKEFSLEEKLEAISFVFQGETARSVSDRLHLGHHILYEWLAAYKSWGIDGLRSKKKGRSKLPYEERCKIVREYQESNIPLYQLSVKYGISSSAICTWAKLVERNVLTRGLSPCACDTKSVRSLFYHIPGTEYLNHSRNSGVKPLATTYQFYIWKSKK